MSHDDTNGEMEERIMSEDGDSDDDDDEASQQEPVAAAPNLYQLTSYFRQTRKQKILKVVQETYIRDDLGFGNYYVGDNANLSTSRRQYVTNVLGTPHTITSKAQLLTLLKGPWIVVVDANVLLHNLDLLQQATKGGIVPNVVIPQTSLLECQHRSRALYDRTVEWMRSNSDHCLSIFFPDPHHAYTAHAGSTMVDKSSTTTSINDLNDARIRKVAQYFGEHLLSNNDHSYRVILLTDDAASRQWAALHPQQRYYQAKSVRELVRELEAKHPHLSDLVAQVESSNSPFRTQLFASHLTSEVLLQGVKLGTYHRGVLRSRDGSGSAMVSIRQGSERVAVSIVGEQDRNRGLDGDVVAIALHPLEQWIRSDERRRQVQSKQPGGQIASDTAEPSLSEESNVQETLQLENRDLRPTGKVVGVLRRNFGDHSGSIYQVSKSNNDDKTERETIAAQYEKEHADGTTTCVFFPVDEKTPAILIRTSQRDRLLGQRIIVRMDSWPAHSKFPLGHYVRTIGKAGTKEVETQVLLYEHDIPHEPFPASVLACLPPEDYRIDAETSPGREDLRKLPVLSIDPPGCKDIDDALHCIELPNGNYQVGVHIADVTHYVKPGTAIDLEAANRSTSTYLVNKRLDMLPGLLTTDLCSLKGNVDRYAFSVLWEVTPEAEIINVDFKKSLIHSIAALTYQQAQSLIDQPDDPNDVQAGAVKRLAHLARKFRQRRIEAGALTLASPEVKFVLDSESLNPTDVQAYALLEANAVVEEFMLLANVTVSKKILRHFPTLSILRRHPSPNRAMFDGLISKARSRSLTINIEDSKQLADSLDAAQVESDPYINKLLRILSTRCMSPAQYFCSGEFRPQEWHHYGLAAPVYTHFTSPIRRYADVCVHRLLAAAIGVSPLPPRLSSKSFLHDLAANMNRRHRAAQMAGRASVQLHTLIFFAGDGAKEEDAYVLDVETDKSKEPSFSVMVPRYGIEGRVLLKIKADSPDLKSFPEEHRMEYSNSDGSKVSIQVFDKIQVKLWVKEIQDHQRELVIDLLSPIIGPQGRLGDESRRKRQGKAFDVASKKSNRQKRIKR